MSRNTGSVADLVKSMAASAEPLLLWALFSLLAIAIVGPRPHVALVIALLGGVAMGLGSWAGYLARYPSRADQADGGNG